MWPTLNLTSHLTSQSRPTRAQNSLLPIGVTSLARNRGGGLGVLSRIRLRSSMTLRRSFRLQPYSRALRFCVIRQCASCSDRCRFGLAEDAASLRAHPCPIVAASRRFHSRYASQLFCYNEVCCLGPLLSQKCKGRTIGCHTLDGLHDHLYLNDIEVQI
jgi:hypothetical protein